MPSHKNNFTTVWETLVRDETWTSCIYQCPPSKFLKSVSVAGFRKLSNYTTHLTRSILGYEKFAPKVSIKERIYEIMDAVHVFSYKRDTNWKHQNHNSTKPRSTKYDLRHHLKLNCKETYKPWIFESVLLCSTERLPTLSGNPRNMLWNWYGANTYLFLEAPDSCPGTNTMFWRLVLNGYWWLQWWISNIVFWE